MNDVKLLVNIIQKWNYNNSFIIIKKKNNMSPVILIINIIYICNKIQKYKNTNCIFSFLSFLSFMQLINRQRSNRRITS